MADKLTFPPLLSVETFCLPLPTFGGIQALLRNALTISDTLAVNYRFLFVVSGIVLWLNPVVFTWPVLPFKYTFVYILYLLGFEKGRIRKASHAARYQREFYGGEIPSYSTFSYMQSAGTIGGMEDEYEDSQPIYAKVLGWAAGILAVRALFL